MTPTVEGQYALMNSFMMTSRLEGKNGCNSREREYVKPCAEVGEVCPLYHILK